jgi:signal transduction histidine kinase
MSRICLYTEGMKAAKPTPLPFTLGKNRTAVTEAQWVRSESIRHVMSSVVNTQLLMFSAMLVMTSLLYGHVSTPALLIWFGVNVSFSALRLWFLRGYSKSDKTNHIADRAVYFRRYARLAPFSGFIWGSAVYLFNGIDSPNIAILCLIIIVLFGMFSVSNLSSRLRLLKHFLFAYWAGLTSAILLHLALDLATYHDTVQFWYLVMVIVFIYVQLRTGKHINSTYTEGLKLQYRNRKLIASLTEQRETALAAVATKNRMLASAAHDMRQPVLALDLYAGWLADDPTASADIAPKIAASTKAVIGLFDSMFDMSQLTEGQISTHLESVNLNDLFSALYTQYQPIAATKNLYLRTHPIQGTVFTDYILLERILGNLLTNAIKYTQTGGVLLACRNSKRGVKIEVWDTGVGIAPDQQSLVFKEFYKSPANAGTSDGFGLGLAIVTQLADLIGAELTLKSKRGRGTVVSLQLGQIV